MRRTLFADTNCERPLPLNESAETLRRTDMPSSRCLYQLVPLEPRTDGTGCSLSEEEETELLPTPVVVDNPHPNSKVNEQGRRYNEKAESSHSMGLSDLAHHRLLPTPLVVEREHPERVEALRATGATKINSRANGEQRPNGIVDFMNFYGMLPTPQTTDYNTGLSPEAKEAKLERYKDKGIVPSGTYQLRQMAIEGLLPTPITGEYRDNALTENSVGRGIQENLSRRMARHIAETDGFPTDGGPTFRLSPLFTEEMMGFPFLWTTLPFLRPSGAPKPSKPTATP